MGSFHFSTSSSANYYFDQYSNSCDNVAARHYISKATISPNSKFYWKAGGNRSYTLYLQMNVASQGWATCGDGQSVGKDDSTSDGTCGGNVTAANANTLRNKTAAAVSAQARLHESRDTTDGRITGSGDGKSGSFTTTEISALDAPSSVTLTKGTATKTATVSWSGGGSSKTANIFQGYTIILSTNKSTTNYSTTSNGTSVTFSNVTPGTYYAGVYCRSDVNGKNSSTTWSGAVSLTWTGHPIVSVGSVITKAQMDTLRSYKIENGVTPTAVTQGGIIYASTGNTYKSASGIIYASWYNGA